ncbi:MAG: transporter [Marinomonas sp.]|nr:transporter [Marinomonas sp.]
MESLQQLINILLPVFIVVLCGFIYSKVSPTDMSVANKLNMNLFVPVLIFSVMASKDFQILNYLGVLAAGVFIVLFSGVVALPVARKMGLQWRTFLPPMMFNNIGNLGIPIIVLTFGESVLPLAIVLFMVENLLHFTVGMKMLNPRANFARVLKVPIVVASLLGVSFSLLGWHLPQAMQISTDMMGQISIPLMLFALGVRISNVDFREWRIGVIGGVMSPLTGLCGVAIIALFFDLPEGWLGVLIIFACLPPAIMNYMVAEIFNQEPHKVASIVMTGNLMSLFILPIALLMVV